MKKITLCLMLIFALIIVPGAIFAAEETAEVDSYQELVNALADSTKTTIKLVGGFELDSTVAVTRSVTIINGGDYKITTKSSVKKSFVIENTTDEYINVKFEGVTITNATPEGRCIDTRNDKINLTLSGVKLQTTSAQNNQALTLGGDEKTGDLKVEMINSSATSAGVAGYGIITFVPAHLTIKNSSVTGYAALYVKPGSAGLKVDVINSTLEGVNNHTGSSDSFGTIIVEDSNVTINVNKNSTIKSTGKGQQLILGDISTGSVGNKINISSATIDANGEFAYVGNAKTELSVGVGVSSNIEIPVEYLPEGTALEPKYDEDDNIIGWGITERTIKVEGLENVLDAKEAEKILLDSLDKYFKDNPGEAEYYKYSNITITVDFDEIPLEEVNSFPLKEWESFVNALNQKDENAKMTKKFVYVWVGDRINGFPLTELVKPITFKVSLPENLPNVAEGYERVFYAVNEHFVEYDFEKDEPKYEYSVMDAKKSEDGKVLLISSEILKESYAFFGIGYSDVKKEVTPPADDGKDEGATGEAGTGTVKPEAKPTDKVEDKVENKVEDKKEDANIENSETGDNVLVFAGLAIVSIVGLGIVTKKYLVKNY